MFERRQISKVIGLHEKSYALLRWVNQGLRESRVNFSRIHESMSMAGAAREWITRNFQNLPEDLRPGRSEIGEFAHLFASYLATSFRLSEKRVVTECGCDCELCSYLVAGKHLMARSPSRKDSAALKLLALRKIVEEMKAPLLEDDLEKLAQESPEMSDALAWAAYGNELMRRTEFASQGEGVLALWRDIAWVGNEGVRRNFKLKAEKFIQAEEMIKQRVNEVVADALS